MRNFLFGLIVILATYDKASYGNQLEKSLKTNIYDESGY